MPLVLRNAVLADLDPPRVETGNLRIDAGRIVSRGAVVPAGTEIFLELNRPVMMNGAEVPGA